MIDNNIIDEVLTYLNKYDKLSIEALCRVLNKENSNWSEDNCKRHISDMIDWGLLLKTIQDGKNLVQITASGRRILAIGGHAKYEITILEKDEEERRLRIEEVDAAKRSATYAKWAIWISIVSAAISIFSLFVK